MIDVDATDRSLRADCLRYIRASAEDVDRADPSWEDVIERAQEPVARAWLLAADDEWLDADGAERPTILDVIDNSMASDFLVYADDEEKQRVIAHLDRAIAEYEEQA